MKLKKEKQNKKLNYIFEHELKNLNEIIFNYKANMKFAYWEIINWLAWKQEVSIIVETEPFVWNANDYLIEALNNQKNIKREADSLLVGSYNLILDYKKEKKPLNNEAIDVNTQPRISKTVLNVKKDFLNELLRGEIRIINAKIDNIDIYYDRLLKIKKNIKNYLKKLIKENKISKEDFNSDFPNKNEVISILKRVKEFLTNMLNDKPDDNFLQSKEYYLATFKILDSYSYTVSLPIDFMIAEDINDLWTYNILDLLINDKSNHLLDFLNDIYIDWYNNIGCYKNIYLERELRDFKNSKKNLKNNEKQEFIIKNIFKKYYWVKEKFLDQIKFSYKVLDLDWDNQEKGLLEIPENNIEEKENTKKEN